ncbi:MAG: penicillin-binding protein 1B [Gammaproteobacteria bacterium]|nr:penicillin-binding protein 1B [Gammaproteobacteria bacterium]
MPRTPPRRTGPTTRYKKLAIFYFGHLALWLFLAFIAYWAWLDHKVIAAFEVRRWDLPARIYAAPLELYRGLRLRASSLEQVLQMLGYRKVQTAPGPGQYAARDLEWSIHTRGFTFSDSTESSRRVTLRFDHNAISDLAGERAELSPGLVRLEPLEIGRVHPESFEDRVLLSRGELPAIFKRALIAVEDRRFYSHIGLDAFGLLRAVVVNIRHGGISQGGSTLTQQLVKNMYLDSERSLVRKFNEALMAVSIERRYSKEDILETYCNEVFLGQDGNRAVHGFGLAARFYFGRPLNELSVPEVALLIGMIRGPSQYNPFKYAARALARRNVVLRTLRDEGVISDAEFTQYSASVLTLRAGTWSAGGRYAAFLDLVRRQLKDDYRESDLQTGGLKVFTTLDIVAHEAAENALQSVVPALERGHPKLKGELQAAVIVTDARTADIKALLGGRSEEAGGFNRALDAKRQIGSLIKPFVYMTALANAARFNVATELSDAPHSWQGADGKMWTPKNYDGQYSGPVQIQNALARSLNSATVDLGFRIGTEAVGQTLHRLGFDGTIPNYPALFLGAIDMSPYQIAQLYQVIANDGFRVPLRAIQAVVDSRNQPIKRYGLRVTRVLDAPTAFLVRYLLTRVVAVGTAHSLAAEFPAALPLAGKTGTTNDTRDSWFVGFSGTDLATVWIGRDDNQVAGLTGATGALRVWTETMKQVGLTPINMVPPDSIAWHWVIPDGTGLSTADCPGATWVPLNKSFIPSPSYCAGNAAGFVPFSQPEITP